ncbi:MAG: hypothetical protein EAX95_16550, partial [Candidatus Thorarchaeota archaeon]|nr:hypothetical protein [Candidatus Thorarchaeota archaeon]
PESVHIDTLAEFTQKLREVIYSHGLDETHILADRLKNLEGTLLNRLKRQAIDQISRLSMRGVSDEEDKISAQEISGLVAKEICVLNPSAAVRALQQLMEQRNLVELRGFAERGVMKADPQQVLQKTLTTAEISRLISRHRVVRRRPDGTYVMEPDLVGATQEIMNRLVEQWARKAYDIWKNGLFQAMRTIILEALPKQLPERQKVLIAAYGISTVYKHAVSNALGKAGAFAGEIMSGGGLTRDCVVEAVKHASLPEDAQNRILNSLDTGGVEL